MKKFAIIFALSILFSGCSGCSKSGRMKKTSNGSNNFVAAPENQEKNNVSRSTTIKMERVGGVYQIPVEIDDVLMRFIFDTGASSISISDVEAYFLYKQGKLSDNDILNNESFSDANGDISEGTIINLQTVKIGSRTLTNVKASVVHNLKAPLLFGETALEQFGKVSIDYKNGEITFE